MYRDLMEMFFSKLGLNRIRTNINTNLEIIIILFDIHGRIRHIWLISKLILSYVIFLKLILIYTHILWYYNFCIVFSIYYTNGMCLILSYHYICVNNILMNNTKFIIAHGKETEFMAPAKVDWTDKKIQRKELQIPCR